MKMTKSADSRMGRRSYKKDKALQASSGANKIGIIGHVWR